MSRPFYLVIVLALLNVMGRDVGATEGTPARFDDLAGEYFFGDGTGVNCTLKLQTPGTFSFVWRGCLGTYGQHNGKAAVEKGELHLTPGQPNSSRGFGGTPTEFVPVRWGKRMYLVAADEMAEFCGAINNGGEPRKAAQGMFYLRQNDWEKTVTDAPAVPAVFEKFILEKPVHGKVTKRIGTYEAWANIGAKEGLFPGMTLTAEDADKMLYAAVRVVAVEPDHCRIKSEVQRDKSDRLVIGESVFSRFAR